MAKTLSTTLRVKFTADFQDDSALNTALGNLAYALAEDLADGTAANQADRIHASRRTLTATSENLDLAGVLLDAYSAVITFAKIRAMIIHNRTLTTGFKLAVGGAASNQFINWVGNANDIINVGPGGTLVLTSPVDGFAVTPDTGDLLKVDAGANTIQYDVFLIGTSA
jgi:hypothetical protein